MKYVTWSIRILLALLLLALLDFYLPAKDVVRIVDTDVKRMNVVSRDFVEEDAVNSSIITRDVRFINTVWPDGKPRVYRNEETGWGFPFYFKFDSGNLQTEAQDQRSTADAPNWVIVTHYGWRIEIFSMFPNAVHVETAPGPDHTAFSIFRIVFFFWTLVMLLALWWAWRRFRQRVWDPFMETLALDERFDNASNSITQLWRWTKANRRDRKGARQEERRSRYGQGRPR